MIEEDYRFISCGGDPFTYLKSVFRSAKVELEEGQEMRILLMKDKFPYERNIFDAMAKQNCIKIEKFQYSGDELHIEMLREKC
ncbi:hypothetical protein [Caldiplasma sukawensis]